MSKLTILPVGESAGENWNRYVNTEVDTLLEEFAQTSDPVKQKEIMGQIQMIFVKEAPVIPLFPGPDWYEYNTTHFTGFPTKEDPYSPGPPFTAPYEHTLIVLTTVKPK
jgi:peptide/nickel transport system substrate-binding protein